MALVTGSGGNLITQKITIPDLWDDEHCMETIRKIFGPVFLGVV
jgi:hypothetical protein